MKYEEMMEVTSSAVMDLLSGLENTFENLGESEEDKSFSPHFSTFVDMVRCLVSQGWTIEELVKELQDHGSDQNEYNQKQD